MLINPLFPEVVYDFFLCSLNGVVDGLAALAKALSYLPRGEALHVLIENLHLQVAEDVVPIVEDVVGYVLDYEHLVGAVGRIGAQGIP